LPVAFKRYCAEISINTSSIQYESDDLMRPEMGDDYCIACCVSCMRVGKDMQFFGARANLAKCLLYAINGGKDELMKDKKTGKPMQVSPEFMPIMGDGALDYKEVCDKFENMMKWLADLYVNTLNLIHYMHDKYSYEALELALHDTKVGRFFATGIAGLSCAADQGLVHGDIKPENILFDASGAAKVVDFGLAGMQDENSGDEIWGTPYYIAPEKVRKGATDFRVDMYSLGATIYHALVGEAPFEGTDPNEVVKARFMTDAKPPSEVRPGLPAELDRVILKMMAREVIDRYPTWEACIGDINKVLAAGIVIDESAVAKAELGESATVEEGSPSEATSTSSTSVKTGGRRLVMKGRRKMVVKKRTDASTVAEPVETGSQVQADVDGASDLEPADIPSESEVADVAETEPTAPEGKKQMTIGKMIMLGAIAIVAILAVSAGGLVWYMQHSKAVEEQKRMELLAAKTAEAKDAIRLRSRVRGTLPIWSWIFASSPKSRLRMRQMHSSPCLIQR
ncbi:MAG: protein kinase, partial [Kiritimatiellae bacterium]|nr:protein kinase [Kiritimatiellia bacterium]